MATKDSNIVFRRTKADEVIDLRHRVLRVGLPRESAIFENDALPTTLHFGAFTEQKMICCLSLMLSSWRNQPAWQLRGMATDAAFRGGGIGQVLATFAINEARNVRPDIDLFWCNARAASMYFYRRLGWSVESEPFEIPITGEHVKMLFQRR